MDFAPHLAAIFAAVGDAATWAPAGGQVAGLQGVFRSPYAEAFGAVAGSQPTFEVALPNNCTKGDALTVVGRGDFIIVGRHEDAGNGKAILILEEA